MAIGIDAISRDASGLERESNVVSMTFDFVWLDLRGGRERCGFASSTVVIGSCVVTDDEEDTDASSAGTIVNGSRATPCPAEPPPVSA